MKPVDRLLPATASVIAALLAGCGLANPAGSTVPRVADTDVDAEVASARPDDQQRWRVAEPAEVDGDLLRPDVLVLADEPIEQDLRRWVSDLDGVQATAVLSMSSVAVGERAVTLASGDLDTLRPFTPRSTAHNREVWQVVAAGDVALDHRIGADLQAPLGEAVALRTLGDKVALRVGAYAATVPGVDGFVNERRGAQLGIAGDNAMLLAAEGGESAAVAEAVRDTAGEGALVHRLSESERTDSSDQGRQLAYLSGGSVADAVGSFRYRYFGDGTVEPDPRWVRENIRSGEVPILGRVTCHKVMLDQLRGALDEIVERGLADAIDPDDYGGCYVPRFIGHDPARGLSLHTWGIAVDVNVSTNRRGTAGEIDRDVVAIFQRWGFAWGGAWEWTDPMHFELARLVHPR